MSPNAQEMVQPGTPIGSQSRANDGSSISEIDGPNVVDMHVGQQAEMPLRRSGRMSRLLERFALGLDYVTLIDCGERCTRINASGRMLCNQR